MEIIDNQAVIDKKEVIQVYYCADCGGLIRDVYEDMTVKETDSLSLNAAGEYELIDKDEYDWYTTLRECSSCKNEEIYPINIPLELFKEAIFPKFKNEGNLIRCSALEKDSVLNKKTLFAALL